MDYSVQVKVATISLWNFAAVIVHVIAFVILYMKANRNATLKAFFWVQIAMMIWLIGKVFKTVSPTEDLRWAFIVFYYFGICLLEVVFLDFAYIYKYGEKMNKYIRRAVYGVALVQFIIVLTNPYHFLFYSKYSFWGDDFGPLFYVHVVVEYIYIIVGMILCSQKFNRQVYYRSRWVKSIVAVAILFPIVFNFIYITRILGDLFKQLGIQIFDVTPIVFTWSILIFVYATFKYEFFDLSPMLKHEITFHLDTPILIVEQNGAAIFANDTLKKRFKNNVEKLEEIIEKDIVVSSDRRSQVFELNRKFYQYSVSNLKGIGSRKYVITFNDITSYELLKNELYVQNNRLDEANRKLENQINMLRETSHIGARHYVARELHDIIGHSLVVTMKLLEVCIIYFKKNKERVAESLQKAKESVENGFEEMKTITQERSDGMTYNAKMLEKELKSMLKVVEISGKNVNFFMRGENKIIDEKVFDILKRVSTELVTNTLKHGNATNILLSITINEGIKLQYMDNGIGIKHLEKGNGLTGIDHRLALIGGEITYKVGEVGEGFRAIVEI